MILTWEILEEKCQCNRRFYLFEGKEKICLKCDIRFVNFLALHTAPDCATWFGIGPKIKGKKSIIFATKDYKNNNYIVQILNQGDLAKIYFAILKYFNEEIK
jgi:hypothetical protein